MQWRIQKNREQFKRLLSKHCELDMEQFNQFLIADGNNHHLQTYILLCNGFYKHPDIMQQRLIEIMKDYNYYSSGNYTYAQLFAISEEWYEYFKENAWPCGRRRCGENRRGVQQEYVDDIMTIYQALKQHQSDRASIEAATLIWQNLRYKQFCSENKLAH